MAHRILYLPIIEPGKFHDVALVNKRGLLDALKEYGDVEQFDYLAVPNDQIFPQTLALIDSIRPTLLVTQLHGANCLTPDNLRIIKELYPNLIHVNWSGDSWKHSLVSDDMLALCRYIDLQLIAAPDVLPIYAEHGIRAAYWQIAYEAPVGDLPEMPVYDVVFMANVISDKRRELMQFLKALDGISVGIYGDWEHADGHNTYSFGEGEALYKNAKVAIADNVYPDAQNYVSNRPIQALMAGGAILLHQHVPKMVELLGIVSGVHYQEWNDFEQLEGLIRFVLSATPEAEQYRRDIVQTGKKFACKHHTYTERVRQLFEELLPEVANV